MSKIIKILIYSFLLRTLIGYKNVNINIQSYGDTQSGLDVSSGNVILNGMLYVPDFVLTPIELETDTPTGIPSNKPTISPTNNPTTIHPSTMSPSMKPTTVIPPKVPLIVLVNSNDHNGLRYNGPYNIFDSIGVELSNYVGCKYPYYGCPLNVNNKASIVQGLTI